MVRLSVCGKTESVRERWVYYLTYTAAFSVLYFIVFFWFFVLHKSFIEFVDGLAQHYKALLYYARYLRSILQELFREHRLVIPQWDFALGEGADILQTLHYYVIGDPLNLLAVFVPTSAIEYLYGGLILLRLYLSGITFSVFCRQKGLKNKWGVLTGAICYTFSLWGIWMSALHPFFPMPLMYLPLILSGVDKIFAGEQPYLLAVSVCLAACSNFYFFYMIVLITVVYCLIRALCPLLRRETGWKSLALTAAKVTGASVLGFAMSAMISLPVIFSFLSSSRVGATDSDWRLLYPPIYYSQLLSSFLGVKEDLFSFYGAFPVLSLLTTLLLFRKKGYTEVKAYLTVLTVFLLFPFFGKMLNGFSYISNRWCWALGLGISFTVPLMWDQLLELNRKDAWFLVSAVTGLLVLCLFLEESRNAEAFLGLALMLLCIFVSTLWPGEQELKNAMEKKQRALALLAAMSVAVNSFFLHSPMEGGINHSIDMVASHYANRIIENNETIAVQEAAGEGDGSFFRYTGSGLMANAGLLAGLSSTQFYWSISNHSMSDYRREMEELSYHTYCYDNHNGRAFLDAFSCARYYVTPASSQVPIPYGYKKLGDYGGGHYTVYENENALPLGYTYDRFLSSDVWNQLSAEEKQEAMLSAIYLEGKEGGAAKEDLTFRGVSVPYTMEASDGEIVLSEGTVVTTAENATATLRFEGLPNCEYYVIVEDAGFSGSSFYDLYMGDEAYDPLDKFSRDDWEQLDPVDKHLLRREKILSYATLPVFLPLQLSNELQLEIWLAGKDYTWYNGRDDFIANFGYCEDPETSVTLTFTKSGIYSYGDLKIYCQPMEGFSQAVEKLREDCLEDVVIGTDTVSGHLSLDRPKILCLSIPYSSGWTALVDGEERPLLRANVAYMALEMDAGEHQILLQYHTPLMKTGICVSAAGFLIFAGLVFWLERKKRRALPGSTEE